MLFQQKYITLLCLVFCISISSVPDSCFAINAEAWEKIGLSNFENPFLFSMPMCLDTELSKGNIIRDLNCYKEKIIEKECQEKSTTENVYRHCVSLSCEKEKERGDKDHEMRGEWVKYDVSMLAYGIKSVAMRKEEKNNKMFYVLIFEPEENDITLSDIVSRYGFECGKVIADKNFNKNFVLSYDYKKCFKITNIHELAGENKDLFFIFQGNGKTLSSVIWKWEGIVFKNKSKELDKTNAPGKKK